MHRRHRSGAPPANRPRVPLGPHNSGDVTRATCPTSLLVKSLRFSFAAFLWFFATLAPVAAADPTKVSVAAASNLVHVLADVVAAFEKSTPDATVTTVTGASGSLVAQIRNGAPFDVFLSADVDYPQALVASGHAAASTLTPFAVGRLVLWTTKTDLVLENLPAVLRSPSVRKIAIANTDTAPYGRAARQSLEKLGLWSEAQPKIVIGENITQTAQFVQTGHADAGLVALSLVLAPNLKDRGQWIEIPRDHYASLDQVAVLTRRGESNPAARHFLAFLRSAPARELFLRYGYAVPTP